jgi:hypothetical protein
MGSDAAKSKIGRLIRGIKVGVTTALDGSHAMPTSKERLSYTLLSDITFLAKPFCKGRLKKKKTLFRCAKALLQTQVQGVVACLRSVLQLINFNTIP